MKSLRICAFALSAAAFAATAAADPMEAIADFIEKKAIDKENTRWRTRLPKPPKQSFPTTKKYFWNLETSEGAIKIELMPQVAPPSAPPRAQRMVIRPFAGQVQVAPGTAFYSVPPPPLMGRPTRAWRRAYRQWERNRRRWLRSQRRRAL